MLFFFFFKIVLMLFHIHTPFSLPLWKSLGKVSGLAVLGFWGCRESWGALARSGPALAGSRESPCPWGVT